MHRQFHVLNENYRDAIEEKLKPFAIKLKVWKDMSVLAYRVSKKNLTPTSILLYCCPLFLARDDFVIQDEPVPSYENVSVGCCEVTPNFPPVFRKVKLNERCRSRRVKIPSGTVFCFC